MKVSALQETPKHSQLSLNSDVKVLTSHTFHIIYGCGSGWW